MNDIDLGLMQEVLEKKKTYLNMIPKDKKSKLEDLYKKFEEKYTKFYFVLENEISERRMRLLEYKEKKIDPYIAGGLAQGIAGPGAGVYAALSAANNNDRIEENRIKRNMQVNLAVANKEYAESELMKAVSDIISLLTSVNEIREFRMNNIEATYQAALSAMKSGRSYGDAANVFSSISYYKDSQELRAICLKRHKSKQKNHDMVVCFKISIVVFLIGFFMCLFDDDYSFGLVEALLINLLISSVICLGTYFYLRIKKQHL